MATNFPGSADSFTNPTSGSSLSSPSHADQHTNVNDAVEAIQTALLDGAPLHIDDANQRVGIGVNSPAGKLTINHDNVDGVVDFTDGLMFTNNAGGGSTEWSHAGIVSTGSTGFNGNLVFGTDGDSSQNTSGITERMRIDSSGNVGIGTTSPTSALHVVGTIYATGNISGSHTGSLDATGYSTTGQPSAPIMTHANGSTPAFSSTGTSNSTRNHLVFNSPSYPSVGAIYTYNGNTYYANYSDYRLKDNVAPLANASDIVANLNPVSYTMRHNPETTHLGFLAHELQEHIPSAVGGTKDEVDDEGNPVFQNVDLGKVVPVLTAALQEALTTINELSARIEALEAG